MIRNYFKIAWRNLRRERGFAFLNISGLSIGMAAAILILLWIQNEMSMNRTFPKTDRIYLMYNRDTFSGEKHAWGTTPKVMAAVLKKDYPEVEDAVRVSWANFLFTAGDKKLNEQGFFVDKGFLDMFDYEMLEGNSTTALDAVNHIVLTESYAKKLFGEEDAMGKTVKLDSADIFTVTGVMKDFPNTTRINSQTTVSYLLPWSYMKKLGWDDEWWGNNSVTTYALLKEGASPEQFNAKVRTVTIDHSPESNKATTEVFGYPLSRVYLYGKSENGQLTDGRIVTVRLFAVIAIFILLIACINFMNLSTARSEKRAKEVGIRKVVGAGKASLIVQFIGESVLLSLMAGVLAVLIVQLSLPYFNDLVGKQLFLDYGKPAFWAQLTGFILFTGFLAGSYPAFFLSSFSPVKVLKGTFRRAKAALDPRKVLVVIQFTFAIVLIISTLIIQRQIRHAQNRELGYNKNGLIYVSLQGDIGKRYSSIKQSLLASGSVDAVTKSISPITQHWSDSWGFSWPGSTPEDEKLDFIRFSTDGDFMKVMGTQLVEGRDIDVTHHASDSSAVLLNETAVKRMRLKDPVGKIITNDDEKWTIVGVVKDFIIASPFEPVAPMMINGPSAWFNVLHIRLNPDRATADNLATIQKVFEQFNPHYPFEYQFVDEQYALKFDDTRRMGTLASLFALLTIIISCLGLFGLSAYMAASRVKEVGVRKVLGASVRNITLLLSKDFLKLVIIAFGVAAPIAWYVMKQWLDGYNYRISIEWWVFAVTGIISLVIAGLTVSFQAIKAALTNPVKSLRTE